MRTSKVLLVLTGFFLFSGAAGAVCLDPAEVAKVSADFKFVSIDKRIKLEVCNEKNRLTQIYSSLINLRNYPVQESVRDKFDLNIMGPDPYAFLTKRVRTVVLEEEDGADFCSPGTDAFVDPDHRNKKEIFLCPTLAHYDWFTTAAVLIHEARHMNGFPHISCPEDKNEFSCDPEYKTGGSYGTETEFFFKAARNTGLHPALRAQAAATGAANLFIHFVKKPFGSVAGSLVKTTDGQLYFHRGSALENIQAPVAPDDVLIMKDPTAVVYQHAEKQLGQIDLKRANEGREGSTDVDFQKIMRSDTDDVLDGFINPEEACILTARFSRCMIQNKFFEHGIVGFKPVQLMYERSSLTDPDGTTVSGEDGYLYQSNRKGQWIRSKKKMGIKNAMRSGPNEDLVIFLDGRVGLLNTKKKTWAYPKEFLGLSVDKIVQPYYWSKELNEL